MARTPRPATLIEMSEGVKILYKGALDNIIFLKRQQWIITNYSLVVYAVVVTLSKAPQINAVEKTLLTLLGAAACIYAISCMIHTQISLTALRSTLHYIGNAYFNEQEREIYDFWGSKPSFFYTPLFICGLIFANLVSAAIAIYLTWRVPSAI
jgi:hypothetical protein